MVALGIALGLLLAFLVVCSGLLRWNEVRYRKKGLPPGTMGWPVIGETTEFLKQGPSFLKNQRARYGNLFKSHILGSPTVVCMDAGVSRYILMNEGKEGLVPGYPQAMQDMLGKWNIAAVHGSTHKALRNAMLNMVGPSAMKDQLRKIDEFMSSYISDWNEEVIDIQEKTEELWLYSSLKQIASIEGGPFGRTLKSEVMAFVLGTLSLPINFPGTHYRRGIQARKRIVKMFEQLIEERRASQSCKDDLLDSLLRSGEYTKGKLSDEQIIDLFIILVYSGFETVSTTSMMSVKYLHDHPKALEELRNEQMEIRRRKKPGEAISWEDYKSMVFTRAVIFESLRLATVVNGILRKATEDIQIEGFVIPKGWKIYVYLREHNYDPFMYPEPLKFNPWRWLDHSLESNPFFLQFGLGLRLCPGKEMGIVKIAIFLHHFVTRYRWEEVGGDMVVSFPRVEAPNGLHLRISKLVDY